MYVPVLTPVDQKYNHLMVTVTLVTVGDNSTTLYVAYSTLVEINI